MRRRCAGRDGAEDLSSTGKFGRRQPHRKAKAPAPDFGRREDHRVDEHEIRRTPIFTAHARASASRRPSPDAGTEARFERVRRGIYVAEVDWPTTEREARHFV